MLPLAQTPQNLPEALALLFALAIGHALADYPLQGSYIALYKDRHHRMADGSRPEPGLWLHCLTAHCLIHAGFVWLITGRVVFALAEFVLHFVLDVLKCEGKTGIHTDQFLHIVCKAAYVVLIYYGLVA